jgi:peptide/nickel transport system substrate-binding protein
MRKRFIAAFILVIMVFMTACSGPENGAGNEAQPSDSGAASTDEGIVIYVGTTIFDSSLDPVKGSMSYGYSFTNCALLRVNADSEYEGDMAAKWSVSDDALVYTFELRQGVKFSDGSDFTAEDVVFTYNTVNENQANNENVDLTKIASVKAADDHTVEITLSEPYSPFLDTVAALGIVPSDSYDDTAFDQYPIGTGPWKVVQYDANQQIIVAPNENYYEGAPSIKKVTIVYMDSDAALSAAQSGQLDIVMVGANYASEKVDGMHMQPFETMDIRMMSLPVLPEQTIKDSKGNDVAVGNNVTSDANVRKALSIGIDRETIIQNAFNGVGKPAFGFTGNLVWASTDTYTDNQKDEANAVLENAGWTDTDGDGIRENNGLKCEFTVYTASSDKDRYLLAVAVAEDAAKIGVKINVKTATWDEILKLENTNSIVWGWGQYSPTVLYSLFDSELFLSGGYDNVVGYQNGDVDRLIDTALSANSQENAISAWKQAQAAANADDPYLYIVNIEHCYFISDALDVSVGTQIAHPHGHGSPIICNMKDWTLE